MFVEREFFVGLSDVGYENRLTNRSLLAYCENVAGLHSDMAGYGLLDSPRTKKGWVLLNWKVKFFERALYGTELKIRTWSKGSDKLYAYRDFEIMNKDGKLLGIVTSRWVLIDLEKKHFVKMTEIPLAEAYKQEDKSVFDIDFPKMVEPVDYIKNCEINITNDLIDSNEHVHNLNYINFANQLIDIKEQVKCLNLEIMYKKEIKVGEIVKAFYGYEDNTHYVVVKTFDESAIHAVIKLY